MNDVEKKEVILKKYLELKDTTLEKPLVASLASKKDLQINSFEDLVMYETTYKRLYIFYVLESHNNRDENTQRTLELLHKYLYSKSYKYDVKEIEPFFVKNRKRNFEALIEVQKLLSKSRVRFKEFLKIKGVGPKSASLFYNEFVERYKYPVVDANVLTSAKKLFKEIPEAYNANKFFYLLLKLFPDELSCEGRTLAYEISSKLYSYNKNLKTKKP